MPGNLPNALMVEDKVSTNAWQGPHLLKWAWNADRLASLRSFSM